MKISRTWAMPTSETFQCQPISAFVLKYVGRNMISIDPFARNFQYATYTNDLNPKTAAQHHMDSVRFLQMLVVNKVVADAIILDPPYSPRQIRECYANIGKGMTSKDATRSHSWTTEKNLSDKLLRVGGVVLTFGWSTVGMGKKRGYSIEEILIVCHGAGHHDTLCVAERKNFSQMKLFSDHAA